MTNETNNKDAKSLFLKTDAGKTKSNSIEMPSVNLPKGGGAIKGIDEKFSVNAINGTASFSIPLPFSATRTLTPSLSVSYSSGGGNSIFGLGWGLNLSSIKRKTDKKLPQYFDSIDTDVFLFSEAEDLVPEFKKDTNGNFIKGTNGEYAIKEIDSSDGLFAIRHYRPRIEGLFARIERWMDKTNGGIKWRVINKSNVTTLFGWSEAARIANPVDANKIYEWLPEFIFDDKGNCVQYIYKQEDEKGFDELQIHNKNRFLNAELTYTNTYLSKVVYGNKTPYRKFGNTLPNIADYLFQTVFDYGEYATTAPYNAVADWNFRADAFSEYKAGFEIRTTRLCKRVLLFHYFAELSEGSALVKSVDFEYDTTIENGFTFLKSFTAHGYIKQQDGTYTSKHLPALEFEYQEHAWNGEVNLIASEDVTHAPVGLAESDYQFVDLFNEGLAGILTEQAEGWYYKHNLGKGKFAPAKLITPKPSFVGVGSQLQLMDLDADGRKQIVNLNAEPKGYYEINDNDEWQLFRTFKNLPNINLTDSNTRMIDLNNDGKPEVLITEDQVFTWYESEGKNGFGVANRASKPQDEEKGPHLVFSDLKQTIFLADMSGDGLTDIVRIRNGEICYWPNLGYGNFGRKVAMDDAPVFANDDLFNPAYLRLADIDGSGTTDIIYLGENKFSCWMNLNGNAFSKTPVAIAAFPEINNLAKVTVTDLLGNGVACIVWSSSLTKDAQSPLKYIDLMSSKKPHIMVAYKNNLGKETYLKYAASTQFYLEDKLAGRPWVTKLHFPVHCVVETETRDRISGHRFVTRYKYHHGYYDHAEKEFRGFGRVDQIDAEDFEHWIKQDATNVVDKTLHQEPVVSKNWFHTGAFISLEKILNQYSHEYWYEDMRRNGFSVNHSELSLPDAKLIVSPNLEESLPQHLSAQEWGEAIRACKGMSLRSEIFANDVPLVGATPEQIKTALTPYSVATHNCVIELLQPKGQNQHAIFIVKESEAITYHYERTTDDPRIGHSLNIKLDEYGNVLESAAIVYPRIKTDSSLPVDVQQAQTKTQIIYTKNAFTNDISADDIHRLRLASEVTVWELQGVNKQGNFYALTDFDDVLNQAMELKYHEVDTVPSSSNPLKRLIEQVRTTYRKNNFITPLALHQLESLALPYESYQLAYTEELLTDIFADKVSQAVMMEGKYFNSEGDSSWWIRSGTTQYIANAESATDAQNRFCLPIAYVDPYGAITTLKYYSDYYQFIEEIVDAIGNKQTVEKFNFRTLAAQRMKDANGNFSEAILDELGIVKATAVYGKGNEADDLIGLNEYTDAAEAAQIQTFFTSLTSDSLVALGKNLLGHASARFVYDFDAYKTSGKPAVVASILREEHFQHTPDANVQISFEYSNGIGKVVMKKAQAESGKARQVQVNADNSYAVTEVDTRNLLPKQLRWVGSGRSILNNKGNAVKQYEPYFSLTHQFEDVKELVETGVTPILFYDVMGRLIKTELPDGTLSRTEFDCWKQIIYDSNDTILESSWYNDRINHLIDAELIAAGKDSAREKQAAIQAAKHANTPMVMHVDTMGRPILSVEHNRNLVNDADEFLRTRVFLDIEGNLRRVVDARGNAVMHYKYDMLGNQVYQKSMDAGQRWLLINILGKPLRTWDERNHEFQYFYDILHRPSFNKVLGGDGGTVANHIFERIFYGEDEPDPEAKNLRGQIIKHYDTGGLIETPEYNFKGQPVFTKRTLFKNYKSLVNWQDANLLNDLEPDSFTFTAEIDALGRITQQTAPDGSVITPSYNEAGLLNAESVKHPHLASASVYIKDIDYNEKGQRNFIIYGNDVSSQFYYDQQTFRLNRLETKRGNNDPLQDWYYTFDPMGNITHIEDKNIPTVFFNNAKVTGLSTYTYDALYRLTQAAGRESDSPLNFDGEDNWNDNSFLKQLNPGDPVAMRNYTQHYQYDGVGNLLQMRHQTAGNAWVRNYHYQAANNRLISTQIGTHTYLYPHHAQHGFMTAMPHLDEVEWSFKEELVKTIRQRRNDGGTAETTYYQYDGQGQRLRKITENSANPQETPTKKNERIYCSGFELYKQHSGSDAGLERTSLSLMDQSHRFVLIETETKLRVILGIPMGRTSPEQTVRYQLQNHLGSAALELDETAQVISYEEYHPYGTTAYQAQNASLKASAKRYRYIGKERDEESGLEYHSARYYLPWLGRWLCGDPIGIGDGVNVYCYCKGRPINFVDSNGKQSYQRYFNQSVVDLILASGNQTVIDRLLIAESGTYRLNTSYASGYNAGHTVSGDRTSAAQELAIEFARTNQPDGTMERLNPGMSKNAVDVDIGNGVTIPVERFTARELELDGVLPAGTSDLPGRNGWTRTELDINLANAPQVTAPHLTAPHASTPHATTPHATTPHVTTPHVTTPHVTTPHVTTPDVPRAGGLVTAVVAIGVLLYTGDAYAAVQSANPAADTTDAIVQGGGITDVALGVALDVASLYPPVAIVRFGAALNRMAMDASHFSVPDGWVEQREAEGRNPFCAICHGPGNLRERETTIPSFGSFSDFPSATRMTEEDRAALEEFIRQQ
ncbi:MAG: SpvB/TcaC N-terminal domain-containing protein [Pseudomonadota bacterium]